MKFSLNLNVKETSDNELIVISGFSKTVASKKGKKETNETQLVSSHWSKDLKDSFSSIAASAKFTGKKGESFTFFHNGATQVVVLGLGEKAKLSFEDLRIEMAKLIKSQNKKTDSLCICLDHFVLKSNIEKSLETIVESIVLSNYTFDNFKSKKSGIILNKVSFDTKETKAKAKKLQAAIDRASDIASSVNFAKDLVNNPPNILDAPFYAKEIEKDVKNNLKNVKVKVLGKPELKKENMGLFLSVNAGSKAEPRLVHLTYTPKKSNSKTKHICFVGKGLTFDSGGYSLKPGGSMVNMKFDMAGSATVYGAFRALALLGVNAKVTCILGMTDNAIGPEATYPDSIITARNGQTVEILNTDAEGRLVLADCLDYACDLKPDAIIDSATLTGAVLVSLGHEICGVMGTDQKLVDGLLKSAKNTDELMWQLPIIPNFHEDMKSPIADLKNIGGSRFGGSSKAAAFLSNFIKDDIAWAHLDIAGIGDGQKHLPYCQHGASGLIVRSLVNYVENVK